MRKALTILLVLLALCVGAVAVLTPLLDSRIDDVHVAELALYGDKRAAEGLGLTFPNGYQYRMFWDIHYAFGKVPSCQTDFRFYNTQHYITSAPTYPGVQVGSTNDFWNWNEAAKLDGLALAIYEFKQSIPQGQQDEKIFRPADYQQYYTLYCVIELEGLSIEYAPQSSDNLSARINDAINEYFKIPVLPEQAYEISIDKRTVGSSFGVSDVGEDSFDPWCECVVAEDACYFYFYNRTRNGVIMDFSQVPGGYGIYRLPYHHDEANGKTVVDTDGLDTMYSLDEEVSIADMVLSADGQRLLLTTEEDGASYLTILEIPSMKLLQKLEIPDTASAASDWYWLYYGSDFMVYVYPDKLIVLQEQDDGTYRHCFTTDTVPAEADTEEMFDTLGSLWNCQMDFDGERLAVVDALKAPEESHGYDKCGFFTAVYGADGLQYYGEYVTTLEQQGSASTSSPYNCYPLYNQPIFVNWKEI